MVKFKSKVVELVIVNEAQRNFNAHPMHLHGNRFQVLAVDKVANVTSVEEVMRLDKAGNDAPYGHLNPLAPSGIIKYHSQP